jgi:hypothetical protein
MRRQVKSICDCKTDNLRRQHFKYDNYSLILDFTGSNKVLLVLGRRTSVHREDYDTCKILVPDISKKIAEQTNRLPVFRYARTITY